ncbi:PREDICTED: putative alpha-xylosidase 2 [Camelina sativa]|uniref:Alpha-xylosidase 2 n=1 Tax=Camelina sativa TaxID=90675 RepID=A0ABM0TGD6_CAMSA|nr:PREDICTED: putative alpha-xylosidase 2 [Camelina sativa]
MASPFLALASSLSLLLLALFLCFSTLHCSNSIGKGYRLISIEKYPEDDSFIGYLQVKQRSKIYGSDITTLRLFIKHETDHCLRVHITDAKEQRWEVPYNLLRREKPPPVIRISRKSPVTVQEISGPELILSFTTDPFSFAVRRRSNGETIFNTTRSSDEDFGEMVFKDQYLEISTSLPKEASLYGFGENSQANGIKLVPNEPYTLFAEDVSAFKLNTDLYGSHPVYMDLRNVRGKPYAHSVLLLNSNGMDVFYRGDSLTYKVIGGVFDFYFFAGPSPLNVVDQYTSLIGRPAPMPYWSLGFHQCRWGYRNVSVVEDVVDSYRKGKIPLDVIWNDADYMDGYKDFTLDTVNFPRAKLLAFLDRIHKMGIKYVVITDPGIGVYASYGVYQRGMANDVFIKYEGKPFLAQVWPGPVYFPDFLNPKTVSWWGDEIRRFHELVPIDGLWIDMNEVSNFCSGLCTIPEGKQCPSGDEPSARCCLDCKNLTNTRWDDPPYKINATGYKAPLGFKTIATSAYHYNGVREYDAHSIYGFSETIATHKALLAIQGGKRPFILSRSTFVGSGKYAAHWTGDNQGTWQSLQVSISTMLNFGIFGVPMVGSDICGFFPPTQEELCNRWNHADYYAPRKELYQWGTVAESARNALGMRYKLLRFLYTLNYEAHMTGAPIARPLFFSFPSFTECYGMSKQFLLGSSLMISPVLEQGKTQVVALFPPGSWYHMFDMTQVVVSKNGKRVTLSAPLNAVNVHLYQNTILPMQQGGLVSQEVRTTPFSLVVTFPAGALEGYATGKLFLDEDELPEMELGNGQSTNVDFYASVGNESVKIWSQVKEGKFALSEGLVIEKVIVLGLQGTGEVSEIHINGNPILNETKTIEVSSKEQKYVVSSEDEGESKSFMVELKGLEILVGKDFNISWKMASTYYQWRPLNYE